MELHSGPSIGPSLLLPSLLGAGILLTVAGLVSMSRAQRQASTEDEGGAGGGPPAAPHQLVSVAGYGGSTVRLRDDAAASLAALQDAARAAGFAAPLFLPVSAYRSRAQQEELWKQGLAKHGADKVSTYVARPGSSAHETGRAVDLHFGFGIDSDNELKIKATAAYRWFIDNAERLGWFPYKNEAWHWEFGAPHDPTGATYRAEIAQGEKEGWLR